MIDVLHGIGMLGHGVLIASLVLLLVMGSSLPWDVFQYLRHRRRGEARERALLAESLPGDAELPHVLVQIPTFNEPRVIRQVIAAVGALDWPRDRLHIQVLDDSTDESPALAAAAVAELRAGGLDAVLIHRTDRSGFKAGALKAGLALVDHPYVAIFDADYRPPRDFLRRCVGPLLRDPGLAFVQARLDYVNPDENIVTRVQQRMLDTQYGVVQSAQNWSGMLLTFSGTCGVWRRRAIEDAGGWQGDTLVEDVDLSFRAQFRGWRALLLCGVAVPGELPASFKAWQTQQFRWNKGYGQVVRKHLPDLWRTDWTLRRKLTESLFLVGCGSNLVLAAAFAGGALDVLWGPGLWSVAGALIALALLQGIGGAFAVLLMGQHRLRQANPWREALNIPSVIWFYVCASLANAGGVVEAAAGHSTAFVRTPKKGGGAEAAPP